MEFKKINDRRFQCRLDEEDLEDNNISLDDFFKNDTDKIHSLLEVIMEEAEKNIGVTLSGEVMSLQLAPQPDHSILLTVSSGKEDLGNMLRKAGESISKAFSKPEKSNVIKNGEGTFKDAPFETFGDSLDKFELPDAQTDELKKTGSPHQSHGLLLTHFCSLHSYIVQRSLMQGTILNQTNNMTKGRAILPSFNYSII